MQRTHDWAVRCLAEHQRLDAERPGKPYQALFGVVQGAQYEDLRREAARGPDLDRPTRWPRLRRLRHRRGAGEAEPRRPSSAGSPTSCPRTSRGTCWASASPTTCSPPSPPAPTRSTACPRRGSPATPRSTRRPAGSTSPARATDATSRRSTPNATATPARTTPAPTCTTCSRPRRCWPRRCARSTTSGSSIRLVDQIRAAIAAGRFDDLREHVLGRYYSGTAACTISG